MTDSNNNEGFTCHHAILSLVAAAKGGLCPNSLNLLAEALFDRLKQIDERQVEIWDDPCKFLHVAEKRCRAFSKAAIALSQARCILGKAV